MPMTPAPMTPAPMTPAPMTPAPIQAPMTPAPMTPAPMTPYHHSEMHQDVQSTLPPLEDIPADQVQSLLQDHENVDPHVPTSMSPVHPHQTQHQLGNDLDDMAHMENMGYKQGAGQHELQMANMGYDEHLPAHTPGGAMSERVGTPWHEDYDFPASVGVPDDQQLADETDEQFEERVLNKRAYQMFTVVRGKLQRNDHMYLSDMTLRNTRKQVSFALYLVFFFNCFLMLLKIS